MKKAENHRIDGSETFNLKGNQPWIFTGRTDAKAPILWPPGAKSWLIRKDPDAGKDWGQEEKRVTEEEMVGWYHWLNGHEFEQTPGDCEWQGSLACCWLQRVRHGSATEQHQRHLAGGARYPPWVLFIPLEELVVGPGEPSRFGTVPTWGISDIASM